MTIQCTHRVGAVITVMYISVLTYCMLRRITIKPVQMMAGLALSLVLVQFTLGIINVVYLLPRAVAVAHNAVAALLLITMVSLFYLVMGGHGRDNNRSECFKFVNMA